MENTTPTNIHNQAGSRIELSTVIDFVLDAVITIDEKQYIVLFNKGAETVFGYTADEVMDKPLDVLLPEQYIAAHRQHVRAFGSDPIKTRYMNERETIYGCRKDGSVFPAEASIAHYEQAGQQGTTSESVR